MLLTSTEVETPIDLIHCFWIRFLHVYSKIFLKKSLLFILMIRVFCEGQSLGPKRLSCTARLRMSSTLFVRLFLILTTNISLPNLCFWVVASTVIFGIIISGIRRSIFNMLFFPIFLINKTHQDRMLAWQAYKASIFFIIFPIFGTFSSYSLWCMGPFPWPFS